MKITRAGTTPSRQGPAETFTGTVRLDPLFKAEEPGRVAGTAVTFEPGARTAWHSHPAGQTLIVQSGLGRVQCEGGPVEEIRPGDVVWIPADVRHWHGASPQVAMTHLAVHESLDGSSAEWMEHVSDEEYGQGDLPRRTGGDLRKALEGINPPDDQFADDVAGAVAGLSHEEADPWEGR